MGLPQAGVGLQRALGSLTRDGFLEEVGADAENGRRGRTTYRLTEDGNGEFITLVREALWTVDQRDPARLMAGLSFMFALSREEVLAAAEHRIAQIGAHHTQTPFVVSTMLDDIGKPRHVREIFELSDARLQGEAAGARAGPAHPRRRLHLRRGGASARSTS